MSFAEPTLPSISDRVRAVDAGAPVVGVHFFGRVPVFVLGEEVLLFGGEDGAHRLEIHGGGILASAGDGKRIVFLLNRGPAKPFQLSINRPWEGYRFSAQLAGYGSQARWEGERVVGTIEKDDVLCLMWELVD